MRSRGGGIGGVKKWYVEQTRDWAGQPDSLLALSLQEWLECDMKGPYTEATGVHGVSKLPRPPLSPCKLNPTVLGSIGPSNTPA